MENLQTKKENLKALEAELAALPQGTVEAFAVEQKVLHLREEIRQHEAKASELRELLK